MIYSALMGERQIFGRSIRPRRRRGYPVLHGVCAPPYNRRRWVGQGDADRNPADQNPAAVGAGPVYSSYAHLIDLLAQGWQIEPPVYIRPRWRSRLRKMKENTYHFVLWQGDSVNLVSVVDCPEIEGFLAANLLAVDRL